MAVLRIKERGTIRSGPNAGKDAKVKCDTCGEPELQWVNTNEGWRLVPFGTSDLSGNVHALTPGACKRAPANGMTPQAATPSNIDPAIVSKVEHLEDVTTSIGDEVTAMQGVISDLDKKHALLEPAIADLGVKWQNDAKYLKDEIAKLNAARPITLVNPKGKVLKSLGRQHQQFENAIRMLKAIGDTGILNLVGEASSGKSYVAKAIADVITGGKLFMDTGNAYKSAMDIVGFMSPLTGTYVDTPYRKAYEFGGLMFIDEVSRMSVEGASSFNGMTSSPQTGFPDGIVTRHPECYFMAASNTYGRGADSEYVGGNQLDAATLSRFVYLPWNIDWGFLGSITGLDIDPDLPEFPSPGAQRDASDPEVAGWGQYVKKVRDIVNRQHIHAVIGARTVINGQKMLMEGIHRDLVEFSVIWAHMDKESASEVKANI